MNPPGSGIRADMSGAMDKETPHSPMPCRPRSPGTAALVAVLVMVVGLAMTAIVSRSMSRRAESIAQTRFDGVVDEMRSRLSQRVDAYAQILRGGTGLVLNTPVVDRARWASYYRSLQIPERFPGVQTFLWVPLVPKGERASLERSLRRLGHPDFHVWTRDTAEPRTTIAYVEPFTTVNAKALGFDMFSEPVRREAMIRARDTGDMTITSKVNLVIDDRPLPGFIMYVPVFRGGGVPKTVAERRAGLIGYVSSAFRVADLVHATLGTALRDVHVEIYDGGSDDLLGLMYDSAEELPRAMRSHPPRFRVRRGFPIGGRDWSMTISSVPAFETATADDRSTMVAVAGTLLSLLAAGITALTLSLRRQTTTLSRLAQSLQSHQTELEETNRALTQARDAALAAARAKSEFLANMSHEIRTPIHGFLGHTELALDNTLDQETRGYLETAHDCGEALLAVVDDILDFSKLEAGKLELDHVAFDVRELMLQCVRTVHLRAETKGLALIWSAAPNVPERLVGDPNRLRQILLNLLSNAVKFTPDGEVELEAQLLETHESRSRFRFSVRDTGIGMHAQTRENLFQAFFQADTGITRQFGGTGLGLAISARIVTLMGGSIDVESTPRKGSEFRFEVPLEVAPDVASPVPEQRLRVAVVDCNERRAAALARLLAPHGIDAMAVRCLQNLRGAPDQLDALVLDVDALERDRTDTPHHVIASAKRVVMLAAGRLDAKLLEDLRAMHVEVRAYPADPREIAGLIGSPGGGAPRETHAQAPDASRADPLEVLVAEDNPVNRALIERMLRRVGHHATVVEDGAAAVAAVAQHDFDLVLMDVQMPVMDGLEATRRIRDLAARQHRRRIPVYALTADALPADRERCLEAGMDGHLSKPLSLAQLQEALGALPDTEAALAG
ncbi:MAG: response regulator [Betaproteobacteria bacterium]|nr:response regulator [Betaproteobacteria bacterium]